MEKQYDGFDCSNAEICSTAVTVFEIAQANMEIIFYSTTHIIYEFYHYCLMFCFINFFDVKLFSSLEFQSFRKQAFHYPTLTPYLLYFVSACKFSYYLLLFNFRFSLVFLYICPGYTDNIVQLFVQNQLLGIFQPLYLAVLTKML